MLSRSTFDAARTWGASLLLVLALCGVWAQPAYAERTGTTDATASSASADTKTAESTEAPTEESSSEDKPLDLPKAEAKEETAATSSASSGIRMVVGFAVVIAVIWIVQRILRKTSLGKRTGAFGPDGAIEVVATTPLTPARSLHVVRVGDEYVLIGATDAGISTLRTVDAREFDARASRVAAGEVASAGDAIEFSKALNGTLAVVPNTPSTLPLPTATTSNNGFWSRVVGNLQEKTAR